MKQIPSTELVAGRLYKLHCNNLSYGVRDHLGFIGIREKFGYYRLDREYNWDYEQSYLGTVRMVEDTGIDLPINIHLSLNGWPDHVDAKSGRPLIKDESLDNPMPGWTWKGWYRFADTNEIAPKHPEINACWSFNKDLFEWLKNYEISQGHTFPERVPDTEDEEEG